MKTLYEDQIKQPVHFSNSANVQSAMSLKLSESSQSKKQSLLMHLDTHEEGLSEEKVEEKQEMFGKNEVEHEKAPAWFVQFFEAFVNPFIIVLLG